MSQIYLFTKCHKILTEYAKFWHKLQRPPWKYFCLRYVIRLMEWIDDMITDEKIFPPVDDIPFPRWKINPLQTKHFMTFQQFQRRLQEDLPSSVSGVRPRLHWALWEVLLEIAISGVNVDHIGRKIPLTLTFWCLDIKDVYKKLRTMWSFFLRLIQLLTGSRKQELKHTQILFTGK